MTEQLSGDTVVAKSDSFLAETVDGELIILNKQSGTYYTIDGIGDELWQELQEPVSIDELVDSVCNNYNIDPDDSRDDIQSFVSQLLAAELVEIQDDGQR